MGREINADKETRGQGDKGKNLFLLSLPLPLSPCLCCLSLETNQSFLQRKQRSLRAALQVEFGEDARDMRFHRNFRNTKLFAISLLDIPLAMSRKVSVSRSVKDSRISGVRTSLIKRFCALG